MGSTVTEGACAEAVAVANPYLDEYRAAVAGLSGRHDLLYGDLAVYQARQRTVQHYAWAVPDESAIATLVALGALVEVAAGGGYWASLVAAAGGDVVAYDIAPRDNMWFPVQTGGECVAEEHPERALVLCWPPHLTGVATRCLESYGGEVVVYIGEGRGECCGEESFFSELERSFTVEHRQAIPNWPMMHDELRIYRRTRHSTGHDAHGGVDF